MKSSPRATTLALAVCLPLPLSSIRGEVVINNMDNCCTMNQTNMQASGGMKRKMITNENSAIMTAADDNGTRLGGGNEEALQRQYPRQSMSPQHFSPNTSTP